MQFVADSKLWPTRLGSGKPYDEDIDTRIEDWLSYECQLKINNQKAAKQMLDKILAYKPSSGKVNNTVNNLVTAWALKAAGRAEEGEKMLKDAVAKNPSDKIAQWTLEAYSGNASKLEIESSDSYNILQQLMVVK